ncbi:ABC transporter permease [Oceanicola sp. 22II-s10i]|uniref:ABC transporter permease n=1 Tax=Oceanicola sp. 22II-s10i TaxID=1317116 RepID=UPI001595CA09|nr:ABC transporter permease [Oceanicola sp. 22II-s10i]
MAPGLVFLLCIGLAPVILTVVLSFWRSSIFGTTPDFQFGNYARILAEPVYWQLLVHTLRVALVTTLACLVIGYPLAWFLSTRPNRTKVIWLIAIFVPFWISYVVRTFAWLPILGVNGLINSTLIRIGVIDAPLDWLLYTSGTTYLGLVYVYILFMTLPIYLSLQRLDPLVISAAADLGARPSSILRRVILPLTLPGVLSGSLMVFLLSISAYVTPRLLGGPSGVMFGTIVADQFLTSNNWAFGAALATSLMLVIILVLSLMAMIPPVRRAMLSN